MPSETDIVNLALLKLGDEPITALTDDSTGAKVMNRLYAPERDALLQAHIWTFAKSRTSLGQINPSPAWGFAYQYQLPADYIRMVKMDDVSIKFEIEGRKLLTDNGTANIQYIRQVLDTTEFSATFINVFSSKLAARASQIIPGKAALVQQLWTLYVNDLKEARTIDKMEDSVETFPITMMEDVR